MVFNIMIQYIDPMDTFNGIKPDLMSGTMIKDIEESLNMKYDEDRTLTNGLGYFYKEYIEPNMFAIIVIGLVILYLTIKYILKKDREEKQSEKKLYEDDFSYDDRLLNAKDKMLRTNVLDNFIEKRLKKIKQKNTKNDSVLDDKLNEEDEMNDELIKKNNIADHISDDYLLTDDDSEISQNNTNNRADLSEGLTEQKWLDEQRKGYDLDQAAKIMFGQ